MPSGVLCSLRKYAPFACLSMLVLTMLSVPVLAQNSIQLFGPVDVRLSATGTGYGSNAVNFNSSTLNLTCPAGPIAAVLSSTPDGTGNLLVDNNINVSVTAGSTTTGPTNVCVGGVNGAPTGPFQNCFGTGYETGAGSGSLTGLDPDNFVAADGIPPIDISGLLVPGSIQVQIALQDEFYGPGFYLASSTLYLDTNCTQGGVTGPALVTGNPISGSNPTPDQLSQDFNFNPTTNQQIGFEYDLTDANAAGGLTITDGTIPQVSDSPIDPSNFQSTYVSGTSFATSSCLVHSGEQLSNGQPACKLYTLLCTVGTGSEASGAQCPVSNQSNEIFKDVFSGPAFTLSDHQGIGLLMASDGWPGGPCTYEAAADLPNLPCPQNLLTSFTSTTGVTSNVRTSNGASSASKTTVKAALAAPRAAAVSAGDSSTYASSGRTTHPNSTFITVVQVPEDFTTITVANQQPGYWINKSTAKVTLSSAPPNPAGATTFVASPIQSITYGIVPAGTPPGPDDPNLSDTTLTSGVTCPTLAAPTGVPAGVFTAPQQTLSGLEDGQYLLYYYAQDCAGTQELHFTQDTSGNWSTLFYTYPVNVDTTAPVVASGPTLSSAASSSGTYLVGQAVTASFSCTDALSGIVQCGSYTYALGATNSTGTLTSVVDTSTPGSKTFTVLAVDAAGNQTSASVNYQVVSPYDNQVQFSIAPQTVTYPGGTNIVVQIVPGATSSAITRKAMSYTAAPSGTVKILDGTTLIDTLRLQGNGAAYGYIHGLAAGKHSLTAVYSGDATIPGGASAPVTLTVLPVPVTLGVFCWNSTFPYGADYSCGAYASSNAGPPSGSITYTYDKGAPVTVPLTWGVALFGVSKPPVGAHTVVVSYAAQGNFAAATPQTESFTVTLAPVNVNLIPSTWYFTGGTLTLTASVQSWSAGPPKSTGAITFTDGTKSLGAVSVDGSGNAKISIAASALSNGNHTFTAAYAGGTNYGTGSSSIKVAVAK